MKRIINKKDNMKNYTLEILKKTRDLLSKKRPWPQHCSATDKRGKLTLTASFDNAIFNGKKNNV